MFWLIRNAIQQISLISWAFLHKLKKNEIPTSYYDLFVYKPTFGPFKYTSNENRSKTKTVVIGKVTKNG